MTKQPKFSRCASCGKRIIEDKLIPANWLAKKTLYCPVCYKVKMLCWLEGGIKDDNKQE